MNLTPRPQITVPLCQCAAESLTCVSTSAYHRFTNVLRTGRNAEIVIEVMTQLDAHRVLGIALTPTQGLARGMSVEDTGEPLRIPVSESVPSRMFDVFGHAIDHQAEPAMSSGERFTASHLPSQSVRRNRKY